MDTSSGSKVTVEYHDPAGIFSLVAPGITDRLPLRNLNWQSQTRPLRQIRTLQLEFVPDEFTKQNNRPSLQLENPNGDEQTASGASKVQRHQIPGLQQSPFLRLYILRCDDKESYKSVERKRLREWLSDITASKQDSHDACEWMVLHVVIPDTIAASESRWRLNAASRDSEELQERPTQGTQWPGKSTRTVFDKLRADFKDTSKAPQDRIAQIRLTKDQVPPDLLPLPALATTLEETSEEKMRSWNDVMGKLRALTLGPFDMRVRHFEADVAAQEARRLMPGFNFCTFFIYKEGLAKAFEAIGLVEDALVVYDELSTGLDNELRKLASGDDTGSATTFASHTHDIEERICAAKFDSKTTSAAEAFFEKDFRQQIVTSSVSVFDFVCYLFLRQKTLLLRLANISKMQSSTKQDGGEDLVLISEVCWRSSAFINNATRVLRQELTTPSKGHDPLAAATNLVSSWIYMVAELVLNDTRVDSVEQETLTSSTHILANGHASSSRKSEFEGQGLGANPYPKRLSSLYSKDRSLTAQNLNGLSREGRSRSPAASKPVTGAAIPGFVELVTYRAELVMLRRKALEKAAAQLDWVDGFARLARSLEGNTTQHRCKPASTESMSQQLSTVLASRQTFQHEYVKLCDQAMRYYTLATQVKSAESIMGDVAISRFLEGDNKEAARLFDHVAPAYDTKNWSMVGLRFLAMYAECLEHLNRHKDALGVLMSISARLNTSPVTTRRNAGIASEVNLTKAVRVSEQVDTIQYFKPADWFKSITLNPSVTHGDDCDEMTLCLNVDFIPDDRVLVDRIEVTLAREGGSSQEVVLYSENIYLEPGLNSVSLKTKTSSFGLYAAKTVTLDLKNIRFLYSFPTERRDPPRSPGLGLFTAPQPQTNAKGSSVFLFPGQRAFNVEVGNDDNVRVERGRNIEIRLSSGWNVVNKIELRLKPATAGLRLFLGDADCDGIEQQSSKSQQGMISLGGLTADSHAVVRVPYSLDTPTVSLAVYLDTTYHTQRGAFTFLASADIPTDLPFDVDVDDTFTPGALLSRFTIQSTARTPLLISDIRLLPTETYEIEGPPNIPQSLVLDSAEPLQMVYKISQQGEGAEKSDAVEPEASAILELQLRATPLSTLFGRAIEEQFAEALTASPLAHLSRLLLPLLSARLDTILSRITSLDTAFLFQRLPTPTFKAIGWADLLLLAPVPHRADLRSWLQAWHASHMTISLPAATPEISTTARGSLNITISVPIPSLDYLHSTSLILPTSTNTNTETPTQYFHVGEPIPTTLRIRTTCAWSSSARAVTTKSAASWSAAGQAQDFFYTLQTDPDTWLVGGMARGRFSVPVEPSSSAEEVDSEQNDGLAQGHAARDHQSSTEVELTLVPLAPGCLELPAVEVVVASASARQRVSSATFVEGGRERVTVIRAGKEGRGEEVGFRVR